MAINLDAELHNADWLKPAGKEFKKGFEKADGADDEGGTRSEAASPKEPNPRKGIETLKEGSWTSLRSLTRCTSSARRRVN